MRLGLTLPAASVVEGSLERFLSVHLSHASIAGETVRFDLSNYLSTVTREMLQLRLRRTGQALGVSSQQIPANVSADGAELLVDAAALLAINGRVRERLEDRPIGAIAYLRRIFESRQRLEMTAARFARHITFDRLPTAASLLAYLDASSQDQAIGSLKFCLPMGLRARIESWFAENDALEALFAPDSPSMWAMLHRRELSLALLRLRGSATDYHRRLKSHQRLYGYLFAEDVDFELHENLEAIDHRLAGLGTQRSELESAQRHVQAAFAADRSRKANAREIFAEKLRSGAAGDDAAALIALLVLSRAVTQHEDQNRRGKMRLLRDLRDAAEMAGLSIASIGLSDLATAVTQGRHKGPA